MSTLTEIPPDTESDAGPLLKYRDGSFVNTDEFQFIWRILTGRPLVVDRHHTERKH